MLDRRVRPSPAYVKQQPRQFARVVADDIILPSLSSYLDYVRHSANGYVSVAFPMEDGMEISCWTAHRLGAEKGA